MSKSTILISGAGIAGPLFALQILSHAKLARLFHPILFDRSAHPPLVHTAPTTGAAIVISPNALHSLYALGLRDAVEAHSAECATNTLWRAHDAAPSAPARFLNRLVAPAWMADVGSGLRVVERSWLGSLLVARFLAAGGDARWGAKVAGLEQTARGVALVLAGGARVHGALAVGADGVWSPVRKALLDGRARWAPEAVPHAAVYGISPRPPGRAADVDGRAHVVFTRGGCCSTWALPGGRQFWTAHAAAGGGAGAAARAILDQYAAVWHPTAGTFGALFRSAERVGRVALWQRAWEAHEIRRWGNAVVVGDAARVMVPASGQGAWLYRRAGPC